MKAICASVNFDLFMVLPRPTARIAHAAKLEFSSKDRSENREAGHGRCARAGGGAGRSSAAGHAANAGTNTSGAGGLYPIEAWGPDRVEIWASREQRGDLTIDIAAVLPGKLENIGGETPLVVTT